MSYHLWCGILLVVARTVFHLHNTRLHCPPPTLRRTSNATRATRATSSRRSRSVASTRMRALRREVLLIGARYDPFDPEAEVGIRLLPEW